MAAFSQLLKYSSSSRHEVLFLDESVFTANQLQAKIWASTRQSSAKVNVQPLRFKAISVVAATRMDGTVAHMQLEESAVNVEAFLAYLGKLRRPRGKTLAIFLDNLSVHRSRTVRQYCTRRGIRLVFNAPYSSEYNPVERLWALAKREFRRDMINVENFSR